MDRRREDHSTAGGSGAILQTASRGPRLSMLDRLSSSSFCGNHMVDSVPLSCCPVGRRVCGTLTLFHFLGDFQGQLESRAWNVFQLQTVPQLGSPGTTGPFFTLKTPLKVLWTRTDLLRLWFWRSDDQGLFPVLLTCSRGSLHPSEAWQPRGLCMSLTVSSGHVTQLCCPRAARRPCPSGGTSWSFSEASEFNHLL